MKYILTLISLLISIQVATAQTINVVRNDNASTTLQSNNLGNSKLATDSKGRLFNSVDPSSGLSQSVVPLNRYSGTPSGPVVGNMGWSWVVSDAAEAGTTTTNIVATSHIAKVGEAIQVTSGAQAGQWAYITAIDTNSFTVAPPFSTAIVATNTFNILRPQPIGASAASLTEPAGLWVAGSHSEDAAHATGDAGVAAWAIRNEGAATFADSNGDYSPISVTRAGGVYVTLSKNFNDAASDNVAIRAEDDAFGSAGALAVMGAQSVSAIAQTVGTSGDLAPPSMDLGNRQVVTNAPAGESWYACSGTISSAANTSLKAAVASNRIYVTSFNCVAQDTTPNQIFLTDGSGGTVMGYTGTVSNAVAPSPPQTFPTPLRGTSNTALFLQTATAGSIRCCAAGYISTI